MTLLLDSSIVIELFRKKDKESSSFYVLSNKNYELCISSITNYEVGIGNRKSHTEYWESLKENLRILPFNHNCSEEAITIYLKLLRENQMIDLADILIAATAITFNMPFATLNKKHFDRIKNLEMIKL
jgi:tRNA(fMet)-specific endonuclease VapC